MVDDVICKECGTPLDLDQNEDPQKREPCPSCGSTKRNISATIEVTLPSISVDLRATVNAVSLLLKTVVVPGDKTSEGVIIEAVTIDAFLSQ